MSNRAEVELGFDDKEIAAGIARTERQFEALDKKIAGIGKSSGQKSSLVDQIISLSAGAGAVGVIKGIADGMGHISDLADKLDASTTSIQRLQNIGDPSSTSVDEITSSLSRMNLELEQGGSPEVVKALHDLGLDAQTLLSAEPDRQVLLLNEAFQKAQEGGVGLAATKQILGKAYAGLLPILRMDTEELQKLAAIKVVSETDVQNVDAMGDSLAQFGTQAKGAAASMMMAWPKFGAALGAGMAGLMNGEGFTKAFEEEAKATKNVENAADDKRSKDRAAAKENRANAAAKAQYEARAMEINEGLLRIYENEKALKREISDIDTSAFEEQLTSLEKVEFGKSKIAEIDSKIADMNDKAGPPAPGEDSKLQLLKKRAGIMKDIVNLEGQLKKEADDELKTENMKTAAAIDQRDAKARSVANNLKARGGALEDIQILEARAAGHNKLADKMEKEKKRRGLFDEARKLGASPKQAEDMANRTIAAEDKLKKRQAGIIDGKAVNHESATAWGLHAAPKASALDALKGRLDLNAKMGETHLKNKLVGNRPGNDPKPEVKLTDGEMMIQKLDGVIAAVKEITAY